MAATSHPLATATALTILRQGGNAVDAAIAASATLCVVEPHMTGIGGDCFAIICDADGKLHGLNASGRAAKNADPAWYRDKGFSSIPARGAHSVTVPGAVAGWDMLLRRFGTMGFDRLFADAIGYARNGYPIHGRVARDWALLVPDILAAGAGNSLLVNGSAPEHGSRHRWPQLEETLSAIASKGPSAFYHGPVAADIAAAVKAGGGFLDETDLAAVTADWVTPISTRFAGHDVFELPPNGQGITALILMNILEAIGARDLPVSGGDRYHAEIEAGRLAYAVRDHLVADPDTMTMQPRDLLSASFTESLARQFDASERNRAIELPPHPEASTVYLSIVDRDRMAVSFINSVYSGFGSLVVAEESGVVLQNRGLCFSTEEGHPNEIGPCKRPMHTIIPGFVCKGGMPVVSFGVMGGSYQAMGHAHVLSNLFYHGMDVQSALDHPRLFWGTDEVLEAEAGIGSDIRDTLLAKGHGLRDAVSPWGGGQIIEMSNRDGFLRGGSDFRKDGCVMGW